MQRIFVKYAIPDSRAKAKKMQFEAVGLNNKLGAVYLAECYTIDAKLDAKQIAKAKNLLANPLAQSADTALAAPRNFSYAVEIGFLPGVTDNIGNTAKETLTDGAKIKFKPGQNIYFSQIFFIHFKDSTPAPSARLRASEDVKKIADSLYNPLIQRSAIKSRDEFLLDGGMDLTAPKVKLQASDKVSRVDLDITDEELIKLGKLGIPEFADRRRGPLALGLNELKVIKNYFNKLGRKPTDVELETLAQTWSEHCKHTIFADPMDELKKGIYKTYIKARHRKNPKKKRRQRFLRFCVYRQCRRNCFDKDYIIRHKVETHNTPSALDPFGGSITGIVGVNRDVLGFGLGAKPIANFYGFCLADPKDKTKLYRDKELKTSDAFRPPHYGRRGGRH